MNGKLSVGISANDSLSAELLNPFVHHLELETTYEKIKTAICTVILLPIRVVIICYLVITAWLLACIGLWGLTEEDLRDRPLTGWRRNIRQLCRYTLLTMFVLIGFTRIKWRGRRDPSARVVTVAPHSTFMDVLPVLMIGVPSIVAKAEAGKTSIFGSMCLAGGAFTNIFILLWCTFTNGQFISNYVLGV